MRKPLGWLFALAVILPSALLAGLAVRAIRREEAYIEKQLATGLGAEVLQLAASVGEELRRAEEELDRGAPAPAAGRPGAGLEAWREGSPLVGVPFQLTSAYALVQPRAGQGAAERAFLRRHGEFLLAPIREYSKKYAFFNYHAKIVTAEMKNYAVIVGAAMLHLQR